MVRYDWMTA